MTPIESARFAIDLCAKSVGAAARNARYAASAVQAAAFRPDYTRQKDDEADRLTQAAELVNAARAILSINTTRS